MVKKDVVRPKAESPPAGKVGPAKSAPALAAKPAAAGKPAPSKPLPMAAMVSTADAARLGGGKLPGVKALKEPPLLDAGFRGEEHRQFPRARLAVRFSAWIDQDGERTFEATFVSTNLSVSGAFLESSFFLPVGTEMRVSFELDEDEEPVQARAAIIREDRGSSRGPTGFGIRFVEFYGQSEVTLAKLFLGVRLREFAETYLSSRRAKSLNNELDRVIDALAAWELLKVTSPENTWEEK